MAKSTEIELTPDDPIFKEGLSVFVPMSRPSTETSPSATAGTKPVASSKETPKDPQFANSLQEAVEQLAEEAALGIRQQSEQTEQ